MTGQFLSGLAITAAVVTGIAAQNPSLAASGGDRLAEQLNRGELVRIQGQTPQMPVRPTPAVEYAPSRISSGSAFGGTYRFVRSTKLVATFYTKEGDMGVCPDRDPGPLTVVGGEARYTTETGRELKGPVGPQGNIEMRFVEPDGSTPLYVTGKIDGSGIAYVQQRGNRCSYNFVWQRQT